MVECTHGVRVVESSSLSVPTNTHHHTMNASLVIEKLTLQYPRKRIVKNNEENPTEILCEIESTEEHAGYSVAIAVIDKSIPHYHTLLTEQYTVIEGELTLHIEEKNIQLKQGETYTITPGQTHWAEGNETWIKCHSTPGWNPKDHILVK